MEIPNANEDSLLQGFTSLLFRQSLATTQNPEGLQFFFKCSWRDGETHGEGFPGLRF
jgi:hypothetical protein